MWNKEMVELQYSYLDGPVQSVAEILETRIENLEKSIPPSMLSRNQKKKKDPKKP